MVQGIWLISYFVLVVRFSEYFLFYIHPELDHPVRPSTTTCECPRGYL